MVKVEMSGMTGDAMAECWKSRTTIRWTPKRRYQSWHQLFCMMKGKNCLKIVQD